MRNWRTMVGVLCIVLAMMLGAVAGFVYARDAGIVGASPSLGARGDDTRLVSAWDEAQRALTPDEAEEVASAEPELQSITGSEVIEMVTPEGRVTAGPVSPEELKTAMDKTIVAQSGDGIITAQPETGAGTRSHFVGGEIDAGGPYGGPNVFEGGAPITFTATVFDPTIIFFRWDFNNDGVYDFPDQTGAGNLGRWTTQNSVTRQFNDDFYGDIAVQGWDGVSTTIQVNNGDNLGQPSGFQWFLGMFGSNYRNMGWQFRAKSNLLVTQLGHYHYVYTLYSMALWSASGTLLGSCTPVHVAFSWNWCTLSTPVNLVLGSQYRIAIRVESWMTGLNTPGDTARVQFQGTYYCFSTSQPNCFVNTFWSNSFIPQLDFRWSETLIFPDAARDTAILDINNVAPTVSDVVTNPSPGLEGSPTEFSASFSDPGLDDTWEYRWIFHDGETTAWRPVSKYSGGAKVLVLHSWTGDATNFIPNIVSVCGNFCTKVDSFDFGPLGQNRIPTLEELTAYDVLLVGTNWGPIPGSAAIGDRLAEYMDAAGSTGGGIVMMFAGFSSTTTWGIGGRWESDKSPLARGGFIFSTSSLGTIYVPGHPILNGVSTMGSFYRHNEFNVKSGATRIADFTDGRVLAAEKVDTDGRKAVALPFFPLSSTGDYWRVIVNALKYASRQADPVLKTMPIQLDTLKKTYADDEPTTTTPQDTFSVRVEVRDDDHAKLRITSSQLLSFNDFNTPSQCTGFWPNPSTWPPGWSANPSGRGWVCNFDGNLGSRGAFIYYFYNDPLYGTGDGHSYLNTPLYDLSLFTGVQFEFFTYWQGNYPFGTSDGYVEASLDGGATWPVEITSYHHNAPAQFRGQVSLQNTAIGGDSDVRFRFRYESNDDWWWMVDNVRITGLVGSVIQGLGFTDGLATIANVPPTAIGGFSNALRDEAQSLTFAGFEVSDPAILEPTEWFAYAWDFDDGSPVSWNYLGSLAPPQFDILIVHTICLGLIAGTCPDLSTLVNTLKAQDDVGIVDTHNYINYPALPTAPTLSKMMQYDVIIVATNWAYFSFAPFDLARRQVGDRLAQYIDSGRGGALTFMAVYDLSGGNDLFSINGRYIDDDYGPFERTNYLFPGASGLGTIHVPAHDAFVGVNPNNVNSMFIHPGDMPISVGGRNAAAGRNGQLLADWKDGNSAIGVKELNNGMRTAHFGAFGRPDGSSTGMLLRNLVGWAAGGIPSPKIPSFTHTWGDNGVYTVDFMAIDDDMNFVWDFAANAPRAVGPASLSHRFVSIAVDNTDPVIDGGTIEAFIAAQVCVRVSGTEGNTVSARVFEDGVLKSTTITTRESGTPNVPTERCGLLKVDVLTAHSYRVDLVYTAPNGGSNPTWLIFMPWRDPANPGHGTVTTKYDFDVSGTTIVQPLPTLKQDLLENGEGAKIDFAVEVAEAGTDDLAVMWIWGTVAGAAYAVPNPANAVYTIHVHHNNGLARTDGTLDSPWYLGYSESFFDVFTNTGRSPVGTTNFRIRDTAVHAFDMQQPVYYVTILVLDDDNTRGYTSTFMHDGVDMEFVVLDLR